jgi:hypothetical protein
MWWSYEANGLIKAASVEICWTARMRKAVFVPGPNMPWRLVLAGLPADPTQH